jgi:hypothetical protein
MLKNAGLLPRVVDPAAVAHYAGPLSCRQRPRCRKSDRRIPESLMPVRLPDLGWAFRAALLVAALPLLAECGPARNQFAPPCPNRAFLGDASDLNIYRSANGPAAGFDLTDLVLHGRAIGIQGSCQPGDKKNQLAVSVMPGFELTRGPAMVGREIDVPVFVAVTEGGTILDKRLYNMHVVFPSNVDRISLSPGQLDLVLPVTPTKSGAAYTILTGFQLSPDQMRANRRGG